jgi:hypothetical protein
MYTSIVQFDLATRDQHIDNIKQQIKKKQLFLMDKSREIKQSVKNNKYLEIVKKEYNDYIYHLINTKKKQLDSFKTLLNHIHRQLPTLTEVKFEDKSNIECANNEEKNKKSREILQEMKGKPRPEPIFGIAESIELIRNQNFLNFDPEK